MIFPGSGQAIAQPLACIPWLGGIGFRMKESLHIELDVDHTHATIHEEKCITDRNHRKRIVA